MVGTALLFALCGSAWGVHNLDALGIGPGTDPVTKPTVTTTRSATKPSSNPKHSASIQAKTSVDSADTDPAVTDGGGCGPLPAKHAGLSSAKSSQLRKLAEHETICDGALASRLSFFLSMPATPSEAAAQAGETAATLQEFSRLHIAPLVFLEPVSDSGPIDLAAYRDGRYDSAMNAYYAALKAAGVTDEMMGLWVLFPEGNLPEWTSVDPAIFAANVTKTARLQKSYFPGSQATILLDAKTYPSAGGWDGGQYVSLLPYLSGIPSGLLDSFGLQGFPWASPADQPGQASLFNPGVYLPASRAAEAARALGTTKIWLNTGSFGQAYAGHAAQTVNIAAAQRQSILTGVIAQGRTLQAQGFTVALHLFAENKAQTAEAIDWSYWHDPTAASPSRAVFQKFVRDETAAQFSLWLSDSTTHD